MKRISDEETNEIKVEIAGIIMMNFPNIGVVPSDSLLIGSQTALSSADQILQAFNQFLIDQEARIPVTTDQTRWVELRLEI